ncbi:tRNA dimethylallyltransferase 2-like [Papaver somniferum]|uniref:tRNA dimethylallyltransferase 2-like n=1 Tax=Papaver somniferum TaxID=3469 RepID=UPI000E6F795A|nr:tRNA dimethylallyltransferase 2-like [Papaver somniferum]XP_026426454.1 tRNA dimethylallyltransferase 2-like [Papaver somniferum]
METEEVEDVIKSKNKKIPKVVIIMGATGAGKSRLAIDLASHFPIEIINADSMQVYNGLDILTNKVTLQEQKGIPHHLLGNVSPNVEFTSKDFRDAAIPIIDEILSRNHLPVVVGGTNFYIQALVSPFLLNNSMEDMDDGCFSSLPADKQSDCKYELGNDGSTNNYNLLKELDPDAANRIHPNDYRKVNQYLSLYERSGVLPSKLFQAKGAENWGRVDNSRYDCCFICVDVSLPVLDKYVEQRVDCMIDAGLLDEVYDIYNANADHTRGICQAIGVREFKDFLSFYCSNTKISDNNVGDQYRDSYAEAILPPETNLDNEVSKESLKASLNSDNSQHKMLIDEAIDKLKTNTKRLVRRQKRRLNRLQTVFGWDLHYVDATEAFLGDFDEAWPRQVVEPSVNIIKSFLLEESSSIPNSEKLDPVQIQMKDARDLWTQFICEACGNRILRGAHEWEQHKLGRGHKKRMLHLKKKHQNLYFIQLQKQSTASIAEETSTP